MFKVYTVNGQEYEVSNEKESKFLQEFPDAELIEDTVSTPTETVTQDEVVSTPEASWGSSSSEFEDAFLSPDYGNTNFEENAAGTQGIPTKNPVNLPSYGGKKDLTPEALYNTALDAYYDSKDPTGIAKYVAPQIAGFIGGAADIVNGVSEDIPKGLLKAGIGFFMDDEDIDEEHERDALTASVDAMYDRFGGPLKGLGDISEWISEKSSKLTRKAEQGKDFVDNFKEGNYAEGARMLTQDVTSAVPSLLTAMIPGGIGILGGIAAADKFEQGYEGLEGKEDDWSNVYKAAATAGLVESVTALTTRGLGKSTTWVANKMGVPAAKSVIGHYATKMGAGAVQEGIEESAAAWADKAIDKYMLGDEKAMDNVYKEMRRQGIVGSILGVLGAGGSRSGGKKFSELTKEEKELLTNGLQPRDLSRKQREKEKQIVSNSLKLKSLKDDPILYKAKEEEILNDYRSLQESKQQINNQFSELSEPQIQRMQEISKELGELDLYTSEISNTENQVETAKNKIKQLEQEQQDIFLNPDGLDIQRAQPVLEENIKLSNDTQKLYGVPAGKDSEKAELNNTQIDGIIDKQLGLINKTAIEAVGSFGKEGDIAEMVSQLKYGKGGMVDMIKTYNPSTGVPLSAYLANPRTGLPQRAKRLVKNVTQQDVSLDEQLGTPESLVQEAFDTNFDVSVGSKLLADRIGLKPETINQAKDIVEKGLFKAESRLMDKNLTPKKRISEANKAFTKPFKDRIAKDIKEVIGKGKDFDNFVDKNWKPIAQAFIAQNQVSKGTGVSKEWAKFPPSKDQVVDYFTGKDLKVGDISPRTGQPLTEAQIGRAISTRKTRALTEALASHIGIEARNEFFKDNPQIRKQFQEDTKIQWKADANAVNEKVQQEYYNKQNIVKNITDPKPGVVAKFKELGKQGLSALRGGKKLWTTKKATQSDLNNNPQWAEAGIEIGHNVYNESDIETLKEQLGSTISKIPKNLSDILGINNVYALVGKKNRAFDPAKVTKPSVLDITQEDVIAEYQSKYDSDLFAEESAESIRKSLGGSPKWLVSADGSVKRIKPGDPGVGYEFFKDKESLAKDVQELFDKKQISKESYNEYKKINLDNVQLQNTQFKKKGTLLGDAIDIAKSDKYKTKEERQDAFNELWPSAKIKAVGDANHQLMKFYVSLLKNEYKNGNLSADALTTLLQWQSSIVEGFRSLTGFNAVYFTDGPSKINKGEHLKPNALSMAQLKNNITGAPNAKTLDAIVKGHMQAFGPSKLFDQVDKLGKTTAMPGLERIVFGIGPNEANNFWDPYTKKTFTQMRLEEMAKQKGVGINEAYAQLWNEYQTDGSLARTIESTIDVSKMKMYKKALDEKAPQLNQEETSKAFVDILQGNWNKDGETILEAFTDPNEMVDVLMNEYGQSDIQAKEGVKHFGFKIGNKIFINLKAGKGVETAVHEAGHLWNSIVRNGAPKVWNGIMSRVKGEGLWDKYVQQIEKSPSTYSDILQSYNDGSNTFDLENEVFARILEEYGSNKGIKSKSSIKKIKDIIGKYFNQLKTMLGFDPTTKNFGDLTVKEMIDLAVSEVVTGNPLANFSQLKDSQNEPWFVKTHQEVSPTFRAESNPEFQALKQLQKEYRDNNYDLTKAIENSYQQVKNIMPFEDWAQFVQNTISETDIKTGETISGKALLVAKKDAIENERTRVKQLKVLREAGLFSEGDQFLPTELLNEKLRKADDNIIKTNKENFQKEGLNKNFRKILNSKPARSSKPSSWFIPPNAEDIQGLLYSFLPKGAEGNKAKEFFNSTILKPYSEGVAASNAEIIQKTKLYSKVSKGIDVNKKIKGTPYNIGDAIRVYNWVKNGEQVDIKKQEYIDTLIDAVDGDVDLKSFANIINKDFPIDYNAEWRHDSFNKAIYETINKNTRKRHLEVFASNVDSIFDKDNMREIENVYGKKFARALENSLRRMKTGKNRVSTDAQSNKFLTWVNRAVATTMFVNTRSAALQLLSSLNFIGKPNNNIFQATAALGPGWRKDFKKLWNSDYLKNRRDGAKFDVLADEMAEGDVKGLNKLLKAGFLPTRYADSFAIAMGGASFYRNTKKALMKEGLSETEAENKAMQEWINAAEESQQSADPSKISEIQSSNLGKVIFAFANTPFQYVRKQKRHLQDVISGRSAAKGGMNQVRKDLQSVLYYSAGQALLFNGLQSALFVAAFEDEDEEKEPITMRKGSNVEHPKYGTGKILNLEGRGKNRFATVKFGNETRKIRMSLTKMKGIHPDKVNKLSQREILAIERALTSYAKSLGNPGAVTAALYSVMAEASEQIEKKGRIDNAYKIALEATAISPPLNAKLKDLVAIGNIAKYNYKTIEEDPFKPSLKNPVLEITGNAASFGGVPLDRVIRKAQNLSAIANEEAENWQRLFLLLGWSDWELGVPDLEARARKEEKAKKKKKSTKVNYGWGTSSRKRKGSTPSYKKEGGVKILGKAHKDGTIEIAPGLSPEKRRQVEAHEKKHWKDMQAGKLDYSKDWVRYGNKHYKRTPDKKIVYNGKKYIEGHPKLPWEIAANKAERQVT